MRTKSRRLSLACRATIAPLPTLRRVTPGPVRLAYEVIGQGEPTTLVIPGLASHITWSEPH